LHSCFCFLWRKKEFWSTAINSFSVPSRRLSNRWEYIITIKNYTVCCTEFYLNPSISSILEWQYKPNCWKWITSTTVTVTEDKNLRKRYRYGLSQNLSKWELNFSTSWETANNK
jgi:hypothetical protein